MSLQYSLLVNERNLFTSPSHSSHPPLASVLLTCVVFFLVCSAEILSFLSLGIFIPHG